MPATCGLESESLTNVGMQRVDAADRTPGDVMREGVVDFRKVLHPDFMDGDREQCLTILDAGRPVFLRGRNTLPDDGERPGVARDHAVNPTVKTGREAVLADDDLRGLAFRLALAFGIARVQVHHDVGNEHRSSFGLGSFGRRPLSTALFELADDVLDLLVGDFQ